MLLIKGTLKGTRNGAVRLAVSDTSQFTAKMEERRISTYDDRAKLRARSSASSSSRFRRQNFPTIRFASTPYAVTATTMGRHSWFLRRWVQGRCLYSQPAGEGRQDRRSQNLVYKLSSTSASHAHHQISFVVTGHTLPGLVGLDNHHRLRGTECASGLYADQSPRLRKVPPSSFSPSPGSYKPEHGRWSETATHWITNACIRRTCYHSTTGELRRPAYRWPHQSIGILTWRNMVRPMRDA
jgi:hypothetical protein